MKSILTLMVVSLFAACFTANAQAILESLQQGSYTMASPIYLTVDPCSLEGQVDFRVRSALPAEEYMAGESQWGPNVWKVYCRIFDITTSTTVASFGMPYGGTDLYSSPATTLYTNLDNQSNLSSGVFNFNYTPQPWNPNPSGQYLEFHWTSVSVQDNHQYEALLEIENYVSMPWGYTSKSIRANEWSNVIQIDGHHSQNADAWNFAMIQPSFTHLSTGQIAGNFGGNNEGYMISDDNKVYNCVWANNQWNIWCLDPNFTKAAPGGIAVNPNNGEVYIIGTDHRVYNCVWANNQWNIWCLDPNFTKAAPGGITVNPNNGEVYIIGTDGSIYNCVWANSQWNIWNLDPNFTGAAPGAITVNPGNGEVYFIGTNGSIYNCVWANSQWNIWNLDPGFTGAAPGAISAEPNNGHVYFIGTNGSVYNCVWANSQWNIWNLDQNFNDAATGAIVVNPSSGHVYFINTNHDLYNAVWANNQWNFWPIQGYVNNEYGSIGLMQKIIGNKQYDMVLTRSENGQLQDHYWLSCLSGNKQPNNDTKEPGTQNTVASQHMQSHTATAITNTGELNETKLSVHPNPVNDKATISYSVKNEGNLSISLYDIRGAKVKEYVNQKQTVGHYKLEISKDALTSGMYYLVFETSTGDKQVEKLVIN